MTTAEFISYMSDKYVILVESEIMMCEKWFDDSMVMRDAIKNEIFHYYHYNRQDGVLIHLKYSVQ